MNLNLRSSFVVEVIRGIRWVCFDSLRVKNEGQLMALFLNVIRSTCLFVSLVKNMYHASFE